MSLFLSHQFFVMYLLFGYLIDNIVKKIYCAVKFLGYVCLSMALGFIVLGIHMLAPTPETSAFLSLDPIITFLLANGMFLLFKVTKALNNGLIFGRKAGMMVSDCSFGIIAVR